MFEPLLILIVLGVIALPIIAIAMAAAAHSRAREHEQRLQILSARLEQLERSAGAAPPVAARPPVDVAAAYAPPAPGLRAPLPPVPEMPSASAPVEAPVAWPAEIPAAPEPATLDRKRDTLRELGQATTATLDEESAAQEAEQPTGARRLEEQLGARLPIWLGSIALFLAVVFLVKYTFDAGLITPRVRVFMGVGFGVLLLIAGEVLRTRIARIAQGITAAGVGAIFAALLAAVRLYHLVGETAGFTLLAATTALAVVLSLRQGPFVALLGLLGGFLTPALIGATEPRPGPLFGYLFALEVGLLYVVRRRRWWALAALTLLGALVWTAIWLAVDYEPWHSIWLGPFLLASAIALVTAAHPARTAAYEPEARLLVGLGVVGAIAAMIMLGLLVMRAEFATLDWLFVGVLGAGAMVLGRLDRRYELLPIAAAAISAALLAGWVIAGINADEIRFGWTAAGLGVLYGGGSYVALWGTLKPLRWAWLSVGGLLAAIVIGYWALPGTSPLGLRWGYFCLALAGLCSLAGVPVHRRRVVNSAYTGVLAAVLTGATGLVSIAIPIELHDVPARMALAWSLEVPALAVLTGWLRVPLLRSLAGALGVLATVWLFSPVTLGKALGPNIVLNWALWGYGLPAVAFGIAAGIFGRLREDTLSSALEAGVALFVFALVTLDVRNFYHTSEFWHATPTLLESATYVVAWLLLCFAALTVGRCWQRKVSVAVGQALAAGAAFVAIVLLCGLLNPIWQHESVGAWPILNALLFVYGVPAVLIFVAARIWQGLDEVPAARLFACVGLLLLFVLVSLEVRQFFQGEFLDGRRPENAEAYAYSAAWIVLGTLLLVAGIISRGLVLRWASLVVMLVAVGKVFLIDTAHLRDLYRVFSFFGLGLSLLLLAYLYQRFVFGQTPRAPQAQTPSENNPA